MIKIGEFANIFGVSIKTIRFYEEKGLLVPNYIDVYSGYRYYDEKNIKDMSKILFLKNLGLSIKEIKYFDKNNIDEKIKEYESNIEKMYQNINTLTNLSNNKEEEVQKMEIFINDEKAIGKWSLIATSKTKEDYLDNKLLDTDNSEENDIAIKELYLMENGQEYWVVSWTKDFIIINGSYFPYEIDGDLMYVKFIDQMDQTNYKIAVYKKNDSKKYSLEEIENHDDTNVKFESDERLIGFWKTVDWVHKPNEFNPNNLTRANELFLQNIIVSPDNHVIVEMSGDITRTVSYTKNYIIDLCLKDTLNKYEIKDINNKTYMIVEWKSGDYVYGKVINCYYVLEKIG